MSNLKFLEEWLFVWGYFCFISIRLGCIEFLVLCLGRGRSGWRFLCCLILSIVCIWVLISMSRSLWGCFVSGRVWLRSWFVGLSFLLILFVLFLFSLGFLRLLCGVVKVLKMGFLCCCWMSLRICWWYVLIFCGEIVCCCLFVFVRKMGC